VIKNSRHIFEKRGNWLRRRNYMERSIN